MSSPGGISAPEEEEVTFEDALILGLRGAGIIGCLMFLIVLCFAVNIIGDVCVLGEPGRARRSIAEVWRNICPVWLRGTQPEEPESENNVAIPHAVAEEDRSVLLDALLKSGLLDTILKSREVTSDDVILWKEKHHRTEGSESHSDEEASMSSPFCFECSICLNDLNEGNLAFTAKCEHVYYRKCIHQWVISRRTDCPNCRAEMLPLASLEHVLDQDRTTSL
jgi:hypothetical protein